MVRLLLSHANETYFFSFAKEREKPSYYASHAILYCHFGRLSYFPLLESLWMDRTTMFTLPKTCKHDEHIHMIGKMMGISMRTWNHWMMQILYKRNEFCFRSIGKWNEFDERKEVNTQKLENINRKKFVWRLIYPPDDSLI